MDNEDYAAAETMSRESLAMNVELLGREHPSTADSMTLLASCLVATGEFAEAELLAAEARDVYSTALSEDHWRTAVAIGTLGAALAGEGKFDEAESLLLQSHNTLANDPNARPRYVGEASRRLALLYSEWGKPEQAAEFLAMVEE
jgi:tetratricopeptide (TPR) repeat protein